VRSLLALDPAGGVLAQGAVVQSAARCGDLVFARTTSGLGHVALVRFDRNVDDQTDRRIEQVGAWRPLPRSPPVRAPRSGRACSRSPPSR
jgi:hypothetical protein